MKINNWMQVEEVLQDALDHETSERGAFLERACAGDEALRREVESLLAADEQSHGFMEERLSQVVAELIAEDQKVSATVGELVGHYKILSSLGAGGMGEVYLAQDMKLGRKVALKFLPADLSRDAFKLERFSQEAHLASALSHPHICVIHEVDQTEDGRRFIVMEYVEGLTLRQHMAEKEVGLSEALDIITQVASALAAAHEAGIAHRDIKPENIMVRPDGYVKVLDFGLAKLTEGSRANSDPFAPTRPLVETGAGIVIGTVCYMSPEQARGLTVDARTDIFSLGCVLYELIAGRLPFAGETMTDCLAAILKTDPAPLAHYVGDVPAELERIVRKALEKDREERYQVIKDFALSLKTLRREMDAQTEISRAASPARAASTMEAATRVSTKNRDANTREPLDTDAATTKVAPSLSVARKLASTVRRRRLAAFVVLLIAVLGITITGVSVYLHQGNPNGVIDSIAVLPFENQSRDPDSEYLSDGVTESIINNLTRLQNLRVIPRNSVFRYKGKETDPLTVGRELGVRAVLTGRLLQHGDSLIISAELIDVQNNKQLWGEQYSRKVTDALPVQQEISRDISDHLQLKLTGAEQEQLVHHQTTNPEAYQLYLKGRYFWNKRETESLHQAIEQFQQALALDPNYALADTGLADCYLLIAGDKDFPVLETLERARDFAVRALQLDDSLGEAHTSLAFIYHYLWQWDEADQEFKRALELNPNYPTAHHWYSFYLRDVGRFDESLTEAKRAHELDHLSVSIYANLSSAYLAKGDVDDAVEQGRKAAELDSRYGHAIFGTADLQRGRYTEAIAEFQKDIELNGKAGAALCELGYADARAGRRAEALATIKELEDEYSAQKASGIFIAAVYAGLGEKDKAFAWLEKDFQAHDGNLLILRWMTELDSLRGDARYTDLLRRMGQRL